MNNKMPTGGCTFTLKSNEGRMISMVKAIAIEQPSDVW